MNEHDNPFYMVKMTFDTKSKLPDGVESFEEYFTHPLDGVLCKLFPDASIGTVVLAMKTHIVFRMRLKNSEQASRKFRTEFVYKSFAEVSKLIGRSPEIISQEVVLYNTLDPAIIVDRVVGSEQVFGHYSFEKNISLRGINKNIKSAETFIIDEPGNIISGGLGLLLIKDLDRLELYKNAMRKAEWFNIVLKHFNLEKDVLECQEELIENGFKEYARL